MRYELMCVDPTTQALSPRQLFNPHSSLKIEKVRNKVGSFSFSVPMNLEEFLSATDTPNGMCQIVVYIEGKPYIQGIISNYNPKHGGFIEVECVEVLQLLEDSIITGDYELTNVDFEYFPPATGITPDAQKDKELAYWDKDKGKSYWYSIPKLVDQSAIEVNKTEEDKEEMSTEMVQVKMFYLTEDSSGITSNKDGRIHNRQLNALPGRSYNLGLESIGLNALLVSLLGEESAGRGQGIHIDVIRPQPFTMPSANAKQVEVNQLLVYAVGKDYKPVANPDVPSQPLVYPINLPSFYDGTKTINGIEAAMFGQVVAVYEVEETATEYRCTVTVMISFNGQIKSSSHEGIIFDKSNFDNDKLTSKGSVSIITDSTLNRAYIDKLSGTSTLLQWMNEASDSIRFVDGNSSDASTYKVMKLKYADTTRLAVIEDLIEIGGQVSLDYVGIQNGKPTYVVYSYDKLEDIPKFTSSDDVFNIEYLVDFADVYNVLTARANYSFSYGQYNINNTMQVTIRPTPSRPNLIGRTKHKVISSDSIKDIYTLTVWANNVYEEGRYPAKPIDFDTYLDDFWLNAKFGQTIVMHGLEAGVGLREKFYRIGIDAESGVASIQLAKRIDLASSIMQARLKAL